MKIEDGGYRAASPAVLHALRQIDGLTEVQAEALHGTLDRRSWAAADPSAR